MVDSTYLMDVDVTFMFIYLLLNKSFSISEFLKVVLLDYGTILLVTTWNLSLESCKNLGCYFIFIGWNAEIFLFLRLFATILISAL